MEIVSAHAKLLLFLHSLCSPSLLTVLSPQKMDVDSPPGSPPPPYMARDTSSPSPSMPDDDLVPSRGSSPNFPDSALLSYESRPSNLLPLRITIPPTASRCSGPPAPPAPPAATVEVVPLEVVEENPSAAVDPVRRKRG
ncbi:hypothetical protein EDD85DRAFT_961209 [Armillaria nabsnona]|nr:hypothetical protein EDD85DRAFT_961209 [Armillaria nabsnona]